VRGHDTAARLGGDEFVLVISEVRAREEWEPVIARVVAAIAEPCDVGEGHTVSVTTSVGVAIFPSDGADPETLLQRADLALYRAKRSGRNRICLYAEGEHAGGG
jgi:diguanylate cyclase (GGDEF)-like protein